MIPTRSPGKTRSTSATTTSTSRSSSAEESRRETRRSRYSVANPTIEMKMINLGPGRIWCSDRWGGVSEAPYDTANVGDHVGDDDDAVAANRARIADAAGLVEPAQW